MKTVSILHLAEPWLGRSPATRGERAEDRLRAFDRAVDRALNEACDVLVVAGRLLAPGAASAASLGEIATVLARARSGRLPVVTTCEPEEVGWLEQFRREEMLVVLAPSPAADRLPTFEPRRELIVHGLGHPRSRTALARRLSLLPGGRRDKTTHLALVHAPLEAWSKELVKQARGVAAYVALGGAASAADLDPAVRDPGPLTRIDLDPGPDPDALPGMLLVKLDGKKARIAEVPAEDRPLSVVRVDVPAESGQEVVEAILRDRLVEARPPAHALLRIEVTGDPAPLDEAGLLDLVEREAGPLECRIVLPAGSRSRHGDRIDAGASRADLERAVLERLLGGRLSGLAQLAGAVFSLLQAGDPAASTLAAEAIRKAVDAGLGSTPLEVPDAHR